MIDKNFLDLVELIEYKHADIAPEYDDYVRVALAIAGEYGDAGRDYFLRICCQSPKYNEKDANYRYSNALRTGRGQVHIGTVFALAENAGLRLKDGYRYNPMPTVTNPVKPQTNKSPNQETKPKKEAKDKRKTATVVDIEGYLKSYELRYNMISHKTEYKEKDGLVWKWLDDRTLNTMWCDFCAKGFRCNISDFNQVVNSDNIKPYYAFVEYFNGLPEWTHDQPDYIQELADRITLVDETPEMREYLRKCLKKWIVAMVAGVLKDNFVNQYVLILLGKQGIFKSSFFNQLLPPELRAHFHVQMFKGRIDRDDQFSMVYNMLVCFDEFDNATVNEMNQLKAMTSIVNIHERKAYGRYAENLKRHNSFCATGNNLRILNDLSGNRRWLVFNVESIVSPFAHPFNYEGIYSQAKTLMDESEDNYIFTSEDNAMITEMNTDFEVVCMEEELIRKYFTKPAEKETCAPLSATDIIAKINVYVKDKLSPQKVGVLMKKMGFESKKIHGTTKYWAHERSTEEIKFVETEESSMFSSDAKDEPEQEEDVMIF